MYEIEALDILHEECKERLSKKVDAKGVKLTEYQLAKLADIVDAQKIRLDKLKKKIERIKK